MKEVLARRLVRETRVVACGQVFERYQETSTREPPGDLGKGVGSQVRADRSNTWARLWEWEILAKGAQVGEVDLNEAGHRADPGEASHGGDPVRQAMAKIW